MDDFETRLAGCRDELQWLYRELYRGDEAALSYFLDMLRR